MIDQHRRRTEEWQEDALLMRGRCLEHEGVEIAGRIAAATGARLFHDYFTPRMTRGAMACHACRARALFRRGDCRIPFSGLEQIVLVGAPPPVSFFAYPGKPGWMTPPGCELLTLTEPGGETVRAITALATALDAQAPGETVVRIMPDAPPEGPLTADAMGAIMARLLPKNAILSDDSLTAGPGMQKYLTSAPAHDSIFLTGGAIGDAAPMAIGAAIACPDRKVIAVTGDGAAMYSLPALWTMAREKLDVLVIVCSNRSYNILNIELARVGAKAGPKTLSMLDLKNPELDFVKMAQGMGVEASSATTTTDFAAQFAHAMQTKGPRLIEAVINV